MEDKKIINEIVEDIKKQFIDNYKKDLDNNIKKMLGIFGYNEEEIRIDEWLKNENYELLMDEEETSKGSKKCFYLIDKKLDIITSIFTVEMDGEGYEFSDILYRIIER